MHLHMLRQVVTPVERLPTLGDVTHKLFGHLVFPDVPLTVVLSYKLTAAVVAGVRPDGFVRVHVRYVLSMSDEGSLAEGTFVGL